MPVCRLVSLVTLQAPSLPRCSSGLPLVGTSPTDSATAFVGMMVCRGPSWPSAGQKRLRSTCTDRHGIPGDVWAGGIHVETTDTVRK